MAVFLVEEEDGDVLLGELVGCYEAGEAGADDYDGFGRGGCHCGCLGVDVDVDLGLRLLTLEEVRGCLGRIGACWFGGTWKDVTEVGRFEVGRYVPSFSRWCGGCLQAGEMRS